MHPGDCRESDESLLKSSLGVRRNLCDPLALVDQRLDLNFSVYLFVLNARPA